MDNYMKLQFTSLSLNEPFARNAVAAFCASKDPSLTVINDIKTAVSEAVTNCIVHAYKQNKGQISIECEIIGDVLHIKICDFGQGIEDVSKAIEPFYTTGPDDERSGMGFTIMQTFMSSFKLESELGKGTTVFMTKNLSEEKAV